MQLDSGGRADDGLRRPRQRHVRAHADGEDAHVERQLSPGACDHGAGTVAIGDLGDAVAENVAVAGKTVQAIAADEGFPDECVITGIYRPESQDFIVPRGDATINVGDRLFLVANSKNLRKASKYLHRKAK